MRLNMNVPDDLLAKIDDRARTLGVNRSAYMCMCIARQIETEEMAISLPQMIEAMNRAIDESKAVRDGKK